MPQLNQSVASPMADRKKTLREQVNEALRLKKEADANAASLPPQPQQGSTQQIAKRPYKTPELTSKAAGIREVRQFTSRDSRQASTGRSVAVGKAQLGKPVNTATKGDILSALRANAGVEAPTNPQPAPAKTTRVAALKRTDAATTSVVPGGALTPTQSQLAIPEVTDYLPSSRALIDASNSMAVLQTRTLTTPTARIAGRLPEARRGDIVVSPSDRMAATPPSALAQDIPYIRQFPVTEWTPNSQRLAEINSRRELPPAYRGLPDGQMPAMQGDRVAGLFKYVYPYPSDPWMGGTVAPQQSQTPPTQQRIAALSPGREQSFREFVLNDPRVNPSRMLPGTTFEQLPTPVVSVAQAPVQQSGTPIVQPDVNPVVQPPAPPVASGRSSRKGEPASMMLHEWLNRNIPELNLLGNTPQWERAQALAQEWRQSVEGNYQVAPPKVRADYDRFVGKQSTPLHEYRFNDIVSRELVSGLTPDRATPEYLSNLRARYSESLQAAVAQGAPIPERVAKAELTGGAKYRADLYPQSGIQFSDGRIIAAPPKEVKATPIIDNPFAPPPEPPVRRSAIGTVVARNNPNAPTGQPSSSVPSGRPPSKTPPPNQGGNAGGGQPPRRGTPAGQPTPEPSGRPSSITNVITGRSVRQSANPPQIPDRASGLRGLVETGIEAGLWSMNAGKDGNRYEGFGKSYIFDRAPRELISGVQDPKTGLNLRRMTPAEQLVAGGVRAATDLPSLGTAGKYFAVNALPAIASQGFYPVLRIAGVRPGVAATASILGANVLTPILSRQTSLLGVAPGKLPFNADSEGNPSGGIPGGMYGGFMQSIGRDGGFDRDPVRLKQRLEQAGYIKDAQWQTFGRKGEPVTEDQIKELQTRSKFDPNNPFASLLPQGSSNPYYGPGGAVTWFGGTATATGIGATLGVVGVAAYGADRYYRDQYNQLSEKVSKATGIQRENFGRLNLDPTSPENSLKNIGLSVRDEQRFARLHRLYNSKPFEFMIGSKAEAADLRQIASNRETAVKIADRIFGTGTRGATPAYTPQATSPQPTGVVQQAANLFLRGDTTKGPSYQPPAPQSVAQKQVLPQVRPIDPEAQLQFAQMGQQPQKQPDSFLGEIAQARGKFVEQSANQPTRFTAGPGGVSDSLVERANSLMEKSNSPTRFIANPDKTYTPIRKTISSPATSTPFREGPAIAQGVAGQIRPLTTPGQTTARIARNVGSTIVQGAGTGLLFDAGFDALQGNVTPDTKVKATGGAAILATQAAGVAIPVAATQGLRAVPGALFGAASRGLGQLAAPLILGNLAAQGVSRLPGVAASAQRTESLRTAEDNLLQTLGLDRTSQRIGTLEANFAIGMPRALATRLNQGSVTSALQAAIPQPGAKYARPEQSVADAYAKYRQAGGVQLVDTERERGLGLNIPDAPAQQFTGGRQGGNIAPNQTAGLTPGRQSAGAPTQARTGLSSLVELGGQVQATKPSGFSAGGSAGVSRPPAQPAKTSPIAKGNEPKNYGKGSSSFIDTGSSDPTVLRTQNSALRLDLQRANTALAQQKKADELKRGTYGVTYVAGPDGRLVPEGGTSSATSSRPVAPTLPGRSDPILQALNSPSAPTPMPAPQQQKPNKPPVFNPDAALVQSGLYQKNYATGQLTLSGRGTELQRQLGTRGFEAFRTGIVQDAYKSYQKGLATPSGSGSSGGQSDANKVAVASMNNDTKPQVAQQNFMQKSFSTEAKLYGIDTTATTQRRGQDITAATTQRGQDMTYGLGVQRLQTQERGQDLTYDARLRKIGVDQQNADTNRFSAIARFGVGGVEDRKTEGRIKGEVIKGEYGVAKADVQGQYRLASEDMKGQYSIGREITKGDYGNQREAIKGQYGIDREATKGIANLLATQEKSRATIEAARERSQGQQLSAALRGYTSFRLQRFF